MAIFATLFKLIYKEVIDLNPKIQTKSAFANEKSAN